MRLFIARRSIVFTLLLAVAPAAKGDLVDAIWNGGVESWTNSGYWAPPVIPNNGAGGNTYHVYIDSGNAAVSSVSLSTNVTIDNLTIDAGDQLTIENSRTLSIAAGPTAGAVNNSGTILINSTGSDTYFRPTTGPLTLSGGGVVQLSDHSSNWIYRSGTGGSLINLDNTIQGAGNIGWNSAPTAIENHGTIRANATNLLVVDASAGAVNTGTMQAAGGGTLRLGNGLFTNIGGLIEALDSSTVQLNSNPTIAGGTLSTTGTGLISVLGTNTELNGSSDEVTNEGHVRINNGARLNLRGSIVNSGLIELNSTGSGTYLQPAGGPVTLTGGGVIQLSDSTVNWIYRGDGTGSLVNVDNTIQGAGNVGWVSAPTAIENQALILANKPSALIVDASAGTTNTGTMRASDGGTLRLSGGTFTNVGGLIEALDASTVHLSLNPTIAGGTLSTTDTGLVTVTGSGSTLDGSTNAVSTDARIQINNGARLNLKGSIVNSGLIELNSTGSGTYLQPAGGPVTLTGGGVIQLSDSTVNWIYRGDGSGSLVNVDNTIQGAGNVGWNSAPTAIENQALILANKPSALVVDASAGTINTGTLRAADGGTLRLSGGTFTNVGGLIEALDASTVHLSLNPTIAGGTLSTTDTGFFNVTGSGSTLDGISNPVSTDANIRINNGNRLRLKGNIVNSGLIELNSTGTATYLHPESGPVTLTGGGVIQLSDSTNNWIYRSDGDGSLVNVDNTIRGAGNIGWNSAPTNIINQGTILADGTQYLRIDAAAGFTNSGTLHVTGAGGMQITGGPFTTSGTVTVDASRQLTRTGPFTQTAGTATVNGTLSATTGVAINGGTLKGSGTVSGGVINGGTVSPGDNIGTLTVSSGGYQQSANGILDIEIGGTTAGTQYDVLAITGTAAMSGTLRISFVNGFDPQAGDSFTVATYTNAPLTNLVNFQTIEAPCNLPGRSIQVDILTTMIRVRIVADPDAYYDVNCDCVFSFASDVTAFVTALTNPDAWDDNYPGCDILNADMNNDSFVDGRDVEDFVNALVN